MVYLWISTSANVKDTIICGAVNLGLICEFTGHLVSKVILASQHFWDVLGFWNSSIYPQCVWPFRNLLWVMVHFHKSTAQMRIPVLKIKKGTSSPLWLKTQLHLHLKCFSLPISDMTLIYPQKINDQICLSHIRSFNFLCGCI